MTPTDVEGLDGQTASATLDVVGLWPDQLVPLSGADVQIYGEDLSDHVGDGTCPLATPDIDGDGIPDLVIGINELNLAVGNDAGGVRIFFGAGLARGETMPISWADVAIDGDQRNGRLGQCVASAGDLDGDGRDELLVGQPRFNGAGLQAGRVLLYRGSDLTLGAQLETTDAWRTWTGVTPRDWAGLALDGGKDVDGGGVPDLLIGAPQSVLTGIGHAYLLRGEALPDSGSLGPAAHWTFVAPDVADQSAYQVALGDVSGDGRADIVVSAPKDDTAALLTGVDAHMTGIEPDDQLGMQLALSDMDDDGRIDLLVGSHYADISDTDDGLALVQLAADLPASGDISPLAASQQVWGSAAGDRTGRSLYAVPDMDNDGRPELLVGRTSTVTSPRRPLATRASSPPAVPWSRRRCSSAKPTTCSAGRTASTTLGRASAAPTSTETAAATSSWAPPTKMASGLPRAASTSTSPRDGILRDPTAW